jgi:hypothetical protein
LRASSSEDDKVLAETTALLVLSKKVAAIFDEGEAE